MPQLLPIGIAGAQAFLAQRLLLVGSDFVVGDGDALAPAAVLAVEAHHGMGGRAGAGEEVEDHRVGLVFDEEAQGIFDGIQRLREREPSTRNQLRKSKRSANLRVVRGPYPS